MGERKNGKIELLYWVWFVAALIAAVAWSLSDIGSLARVLVLVAWLAIAGGALVNIVRLRRTAAGAPVQGEGH